MMWKEARRRKTSVDGNTSLWMLTVILTGLFLSDFQTSKFKKLGAGQEHQGRVQLGL